MAEEQLVCIQITQAAAKKRIRDMVITVFRDAKRPKLSDPVRGRRGLQPERDGRVHCSAWLGITVLDI